MKTLTALSILLALCVFLPHGPAESYTPISPMSLIGTTYDSLGNTMAQANITITNMENGKVGRTVATEGNYSLGLENLASEGDRLLVEAHTTGWYGANTTVVFPGGPYMKCDVHMFSTVGVSISAPSDLEIFIDAENNGTAEATIVFSSSAYWQFEVSSSNKTWASESIRIVTLAGENITMGQPILIAQGSHILHVSVSFLSGKAIPADAVMYINQSGGQKHEIRLSFTTNGDITHNRGDRGMRGFIWWYSIVGVVLFVFVSMLMIIRLKKKHGG